MITCADLRVFTGKNPIVLGRLGKDERKTTLTFYGHYDVVPAIYSESEKGGWDRYY